MKNRILLIHADCKLKAGGDFSSAGELAYGLKATLKSVDPSVHFVLSSSDLSVFKKLYGPKNKDSAKTEEKNTDSKVFIHGESFEVVELAVFSAQMSKAGTTLHYFIELGCKSADAQFVAPMLDASTQILRVGLPNEPDMLKAKTYAITPYVLQHIQFGFGRNRIGFPLYQGPVEELKHSAYFDVTKKAYGFAYFYLEKSTGILTDYIKASQSAFKFDGYVFIGKVESMEKEVQAFLTGLRTATPCTANIYTDNESYSLLYGQGNVVKKEATAETATFSFVLLNQVSNEQMRALMSGAIPYIGVTGVNTLFESMGLGKVFHYQYMVNNAAFAASYHQELERSSKSIATAARQLTWAAKWDEEDLTNAQNALRNQSLVSSWSAKNRELIANSTKDVGKTICTKLGIFTVEKPVEKENPTATQQAQPGM